MSFLLVDNNLSDLNNLSNIIHKVVPGMEIIAKQSAESVLTLPALDFDAAFIEIELDPGYMSGLELAAKLKSIRKDVHIIFVTNSTDYYPEAFAVHADSYLLKKVTERDIKREINYISRNYPAPIKTKGKIYVQTFGGFNIFLDGNIIEFKRTKAKELLALLVDRRGAGVTARESCAALFGDRPYDDIVNGYYHVLVHSLVHTLMDAGIRNILIRRKSFLAIKPDTFECDAYNFLKGDPSAHRQYRGDYMICYDWAQYNALGN